MIEHFKKKRYQCDLCEEKRTDVLLISDKAWLGDIYACPKCFNTLKSILINDEVIEDAEEE